MNLIARKINSLESLRAQDFQLDTLYLLEYKDITFRAKKTRMMDKTIFIFASGSFTETTSTFQAFKDFIKKIEKRVKKKDASSNIINPSILAKEKKIINGEEKKRKEREAKDKTREEEIRNKETESKKRIDTALKILKLPRSGELQKYSLYTKIDANKKIIEYSSAFMKAFRRRVNQEMINTKKEGTLEKAVKYVDWTHIVYLCVVPSYLEENFLQKKKTITQKRMEYSRVIDGHNVWTKPTLKILNPQIQEGKQLISIEFEQKEFYSWF